MRGRDGVEQGNSRVPYMTASRRAVSEVVIEERLGGGGVGNVDRGMKRERQEQKDDQR